MKIIKPFKFVFGFIFVILGVIILLSNFNLIGNIILIENMKLFFSVTLIIAGILMLFGQKKLSLAVITISIILMGVSILIPSTTVKEINITNLNIKYDSDIDKVKYDIDYGLGNINLKKNSNPEMLIEVISKNNLGHSTSLEGNEILSKNIKEIEIRKTQENVGVNSFINNNYISEIEILINPNVENEIYLNYGVSDANIDFRDLNVSYAEINFGVSDSVIYIDKNTDVKISSGISDIKLYFPKDSKIEIESESGLVDLHLDGFTKIGNNYYNDIDVKDYDITVKLETGLSSIEGGYYNE